MPILSFTTKEQIEFASRLNEIDAELNSQQALLMDLDWRAARACDYLVSGGRYGAPISDEHLAQREALRGQIRALKQEKNTLQSTENPVKTRKNTDNSQTA